MAENRFVTREFIRLVVKDVVASSQAQAAVVSNAAIASAAITVLGPVESVTSGVKLAAGGFLQWTGRALFKSTADGDVSLRNNADSAFGILRVASVTFPDGTSLSSGATAGGWTDAGTVLHPTTLTDDVAVGVATVGHGGWGAGLGRTFTLYGPTTPLMEIVSARADANAATVGILDFVGTAQTGGKSLASLAVQTDGGTATNRGGVLIFLTKSNAGALSERARISEAGDLYMGSATDPDGSFTPMLKLTINTTTKIGQLAVGSTQAGSASVVGILGFFNSALAGGLDRRIAIIQGRTDGATNTGSISFHTQVAGAVAEDARMMRGGLCLGTAGTVNIGVSGGDRYLTVFGAAPAIEMVGTAADASGTAAGLLDFVANAQTTYKRMAALFVTTDGTSALNRGGKLGVYTKPDGVSALSERMLFQSNGDVIMGASNAGAYDGGAATVRRFTIYSSLANQGAILLGSNQSGFTSTVGQVAFFNAAVAASDKRIAAINVTTDGGATNSGMFRFFTAPAGGGLLERMRIDYVGHVSLGNTMGVMPDNAALGAISRVTVDGSTTAIGQLSLGMTQAGTANAIGAVVFHNSTLTPGSDRRIAFMVGQTDGATNSGAIVFSTMSAGSIFGRFAIRANGDLVFNQGQVALATTATTGFPFMPTMAGAPTGAPTVYTGNAAFCFDTANNRLRIRNPITGAWVQVGLT